MVREVQRIPGALLVERWRRDADVLRRRGAAATAELLEECARELEAAQMEWELELIPISQAAEEVGKSVSQLHRYVQEGKLSNTGDRGVKRVRRGDVLRIVKGREN